MARRFECEVFVYQPGEKAWRILDPTQKFVILKENAILLKSEAIPLSSIERTNLQGEYLLIQTVIYFHSAF